MSQPTRQKLLSDEEANGNSVQSINSATTSENAAQNTEQDARCVKSEVEETRPLYGITLSIISCLFFSLTAVIVKGLTPMQGPQILVIRGIFQVTIYMFLVWYNDNPLLGLPGHRLDLFIRGILGSVSLNFVYIAFVHISLGDATAIHNMSPIYVICFAFLVLGEPITALQVIVAFFCCLGAIIVARPSFIWRSLFPDPTVSSVAAHGDSFGFSMAFLCSVFSALAVIYVRKLRQTPVYTVTLYYSLLMSVVSSLFLPWSTIIVWPLSGAQWWKLAATGVFGTIDQICLTLSLKYENAGIISMSRTITIVMSYIWDGMFFGTAPAFTSVLGGGIIIVSLIVISLSRPGAWDTVKERCPCLFPATSSSSSRLVDSEEKLPIIYNDARLNRRYS